MSKSPEEIKTALLVLRAQQHDPAALAELVRLSHGALLAHAARLVNDWTAAEEVVQEAWIAIVRGIGLLNEPAAFKYWTYRIVGRECANWVKHRQRARRDGTDHALPSIAGQQPAPHDLDGLRIAMSALSVAHREVLALYYLEGMSIQQIAESLATNEGTIKSRLHYAREQLRAAMGKESND